MDDSENYVIWKVLPRRRLRKKSLQDSIIAGKTVLLGIFGALFQKRFVMILPLQNTPGTLPPDNTFTTPPIIPSSLSSEIINQPAYAAASSHSYANVVSISSPPRAHSRMSTILKTSSSPPHPQKEVPLFRSPALGGSSNDAFRHLVHHTGTTDHSVFYHVPKNISSLRSALAVQLRELFSIGAGLGLTFSDDAYGTNIKIALATCRVIKLQVYNDVLLASIFPGSWLRTCVSLLPKKVTWMT
ncbi:MAG: hypothetical protein EXX96DRAFT_359956 [Benjaminiella poitrasii]|nr:MAG: hypothetical protein EXX96DRAFT_359956 [Benjaminiella poitrasii]